MFSRPKLGDLGHPGGAVVDVGGLDLGQAGLGDWSPEPVEGRMPPENRAQYWERHRAASRAAVDGCRWLELRSSQSCMSPYLSAAMRFEMAAEWSV